MRSDVWTTSPPWPFIVSARGGEVAETYGRLRDHPEIVLLPGLGIRPYLRPLIRAIAGWTRVTLLDLPGWSFGRTPRCAPDVAGIATAAVGWVEATNRRGIVLSGHSTGSQAAVRMALAAPGRLAGLVLASPVFDPGGRDLRGLSGRVAATLPHESWSELPVVLPALATSRVRPMWRLMRSGQAEDTEELVARLAVPHTIVTGRHDAVAPRWWAERLASYGPAPAGIHAGGHNACFVHPAAVNAALRAAVEACLAGS